MKGFGEIIIIISQHLRQSWDREVFGKERNRVRREQKLWLLSGTNDNNNTNKKTKNNNKKKKTWKIFQQISHKRTTRGRLRRKDFGRRRTQQHPKKMITHPFYLGHSLEERGGGGGGRGGGGEREGERGGEEELECFFEGAVG